MLYNEENRFTGVCLWAKAQEPFFYRMWFRVTQKDRIRIRNIAAFSLSLNSFANIWKQSNI